MLITLLLKCPRCEANQLVQGRGGGGGGGGGSLVMTVLLHQFLPGLTIFGPYHPQIWDQMQYDHLVMQSVLIAYIVFFWGGGGGWLISPYSGEKGPLHISRGYTGLSTLTVLL